MSGSKGDPPDRTPMPALQGVAPATDSLRLFDHDIRAAMADVIGGLRLIDAKRLDADTRAQVERAKAAGETLADLVDAALMAISGDTLPSLDEMVVDLARYLAAVAMRWSGRADEVGCRFILRTEDGLPSRLAVPRMALDRILSNLIGNGLKHASVPRPCTVRLSVTTGPDASVIFEVSDDGPGFSDTARDRLFTRDGRPSDSRVPGTGLGLHIAKDLADRIGARLAVANGPGGGAVVRLEIPGQPATGAVAAMVHDPGPDLTGVRVLVVEDNLTSQMIVLHFLDGMGARVRLANDGLEALATLAEERFDLALVDIEMPRLTGAGFLAAVRALPDDRARMPILALTAYSLGDTRAAILAAGADGIIGKPVRSAAELGRTILEYLPGAGRVQVDEAPMLPTSIERLLSRGDVTMGAELLSRLDSDIRVVSVALDHAVAVGDLQGVGVQSHVLVSLAGIVGDLALRDLAEALAIAAEQGRHDDLPDLVMAIDAQLHETLTRIAVLQAGLGR